MSEAPRAALGTDLECHLEFALGSGIEFALGSRLELVFGSGLEADLGSRLEIGHQAVEKVL